LSVLHQNQPIRESLQGKHLGLQTVATSKVFAHRDMNSPRSNRPVIAAGDMTDFGRAAHNIDATGVAILAARSHEGMAAAASAGLSTHKTYASESLESEYELASRFTPPRASQKSHG
jgi:hypothetical protein